MAVGATASAGLAAMSDLGLQLMKERNERDALELGALLNLG